MGNVTDQSFAQSNGSGKVLFTDLKNVASLSISGAEAFIENVNFTPVTSKGFLQTEGLSTMNFDIKEGVKGSSLVTVIAEGKRGYANNQVQFTLSVDENSPPRIDAIPDYDVPAGKIFRIPLTGIDDGDEIMDQSITMTAASTAPAVITEYKIKHEKGSPYGTLSFTPVSVQEGIIVSLKLTDDGAGNNSSTTNFTINAYDNFNNPPTAINKGKQTILLSDGLQAINLTGIDDGDGGSQTLTLSASSSNTSIVPDPTVDYTAGANTASINLDRQDIGLATITVTITDNGDNGSNNGNQSYQSIFEVEVLPDPVYGYTFPLTTGSNPADKWIIDAGYTHLSFVDFDGFSDVMKVEFSDKWTFAGLTGTPPEVLDMRDNPYISMYVYPVNRDMDFISWIFDDGNRRNTGEIKRITANSWNQVFFDMRGDALVDEEGVLINAQKIENLLINMHDIFTWPFTNISGTVYIKDIKLGDQAEKAWVNSTCTINPVASYAHLYNAAANQATVNLSGISNGDRKTDNLTVSVNSSNSAVANPAVSSVSPDGTATLTYTPGSIGSTLITLTVSTGGSNDTTTNFKVEVVANEPSSAITVNVNLARTYQTILGPWAMLPEVTIDDEVWAKEFGASAMRLGIINS